MKGIITRARMKWIEDGEKPTKYFLNLEKRNYVSKQITCIKNESDKGFKEEKNIEKEVLAFYKNLYEDRDDT